MIMIMIIVLVGIKQTPPFLVVSIFLFGIWTSSPFPQSTPASGKPGSRAGLKVDVDVDVGFVVVIFILVFVAVRFSRVVVTPLLALAPVVLGESNVERTAQDDSGPGPAHRGRRGVPHDLVVEESEEHLRVHHGRRTRAVARGLRLLRPPDAGAAPWDAGDRRWRHVRQARSQKELEEEAAGGQAEEEEHLGPVPGNAEGDRGQDEHGND